MDEKALESLFKSLAVWANEMSARQDALESLLVKKSLATDQELMSTLKACRKPTGLNQTTEKQAAPVANLLEKLSKR